MILLLDLGNSRLKWAVSDGGRLVATGVEGNDAVGVDSIPSAWRALPMPSAVYAVSVLGDDGHQPTVDAVRALWGLQTRFVHSANSACGVRNTYANPSQLGADRWAALVGARCRSHGPACVIDSGTAVTIDALSADGDFVGGVILPGIALARTALNVGTRQLGVPGEGDYTVLGLDTAACIRGGTIFGVVGAIERITEEMEHRLGGGPIRRYLTGGDADLLAGHLRGEYHHCPYLVLEGLARLAVEPG